MSRRKTCSTVMRSSQSRPIAPCRTVYSITVSRRLESGMDTRVRDKSAWERGRLLPATAATFHEPRDGYRCVKETQMAQVMTVLGPVASEELGVTLPHEHLLLDLSC